MKLTNLFQRGAFLLSSGRHSPWKIDCDALAGEDWEALAEMIHALVGPFSSVEGVPRGGLALAERLRRSRHARGPHLIVDDVLTTGASMERLRAACAPAGADTSPRRDAITGAVVFARGPCPPWVRPLFQMAGVTG